MHLSPGTSASTKLVVGENDLAEALILTEGDDFPPVFATARMIGLMEIAGARAMHAVLQPGEISVGVDVNIRHTAATLLGDTVVAEARFIGMDENAFYCFEVSAYDTGGEIGRGTHKRAIVTTERLLAKAKKRVAE
jgi:fluoroacetyl-CoA thioesterase